MKLMLLKKVQVGYSVIAETSINIQDINKDQAQQILNEAKTKIENEKPSQSNDNRDHSSDLGSSSGTAT